MIGFDTGWHSADATRITEHRPERIRAVLDRSGSLVGGVVLIGPRVSTIDHDRADHEQRYGRNEEVDPKFRPFVEPAVRHGPMSRRPLIHEAESSRRCQRTLESSGNANSSNQE